VLTRHSPARRREFSEDTSSPGTDHSHGRGEGKGKGKDRGRQRILTLALVLLVGEVGEGGVADEVVEDEGEVVVGTTLPEIERGRTRIKPAVAIMTGNGAMTRRWPVLLDPPNQNCSLR